MSETFQVTARKWRPMRFDDVVGQDHVTRTLKNALRENRLAHGYLFTGQRGCGKTTVARVLAKAINCPNAATNDFEPCNECSICIGITEGRSMDVSEIDGASNNGVDDVRSLRENVKYAPLEGKYKVVIIDEVHMLSTSAFNALLKTLEEPPKHLVFIFATTEVQKVLPTILSRTQRYDFRRMQIEEITTQLRMIADADGIVIDDDGLLIIAKKADGSMRDGQSIFDQVIAFCGKNVDTAHVRDSLNLIDSDFFFEVSDAVSAQRPERAFEISGQIVNRGYDVEEFFLGLLEHFRNALTALVMKHTKLIEVSKSHQERYLEIAKQYTEGDLIRLIRLGQSAIERLKTSQQPRIILELTLVEMMMMERALEINELLEGIRALKGGAIPAPAATASAPAPAQAPRPVAASAPSVPPTRAAASTPAPQRAAAVPPPSAPSEPASQGRTFTTEEALRDWPRFVEALGTRSRGLKGFVDDLAFCGVRRSTLYIGLDDKTGRDMFGHMKTEITATMKEVFGPGLGFEIGPRSDMSAKSGVPVVENPELVRSAVLEHARPAVGVANATAPNVESNTELSPMEEALLAIGAQPV